MNVNKHGGKAGRGAALRFSVLVSIVLLCLGLALITSCGEEYKKTDKKVLILGMDGLDPQLVDKFMKKGGLPHFNHLMSMGDFKPLRSSIPPQSPVAWSNFITGSNPGKHGIYDFIHRNPDTYSPYLSTSETKEADEEDSFVIGSRVIWTESGKTELLRRGKPFWEYLAEDNLKTRIFKIPSNYPPYQGQGWSTSGMGTPDMLGTYGTFTFFTEKPPDRAPDAESIGGGTIIPIYPRTGSNVYETKLQGPENTLKLNENDPYIGEGEAKRRNYVQSEVPLTFYVDPDNPVVKIEYQDEEILLSEGEWSDWHPITFEMWPMLAESKGIVRFYAKEVRPFLKIYASPINMDPIDPPLPISNPPEYTRRIAEDVGYYYTQGMPEDTKARQAELDILNDGELFQQNMLVYQEDLKMLDWHLDRFDSGLLYYYFSSLDLGQHMFWRLHEPDHPAYDEKWAQKLGDPVEKLYKKMDRVLGMVMDHENFDENTVLIVMSDHGFSSWSKSFQVNTWLLEQGYLKLKPNVDQDKINMFRTPEGGFAVDWSRTRAYALGINGVYINLQGREEYGVVPEYKRQLLVDELSEKFQSWKDPETGKHPIAEAYKSYKVFQGEEMDIAPDLVLGYNRGYRGGDKSALGKFPEKIVSENTSPWSGDHCMATEVVPGTIIVNRNIKKDDPALIDIGPTLLRLFGQKVPENMDGKPLF
ncbi:MAG: alkaline phosphatase family protein [bacterium]